MGRPNSTRETMAMVPPLAALAAIAALIDWIFGRGILRALATSETSSISHQTLLHLGDAGSVVRNLAAVAGLVALYISLTGWIRERPGVPLMLRVTVAGFAGILLPTLFLATILPAERTSTLIVLFSTITTHVLALTVTVVSLHWSAARSNKIGATLIAVASFFSFGAVSLLIIGELTLWETAHPLGMAMRRTGEVSYLVSLLVLPLGAKPWAQRKGQIGLGVGFVLGLVVLIGTVQVRQSFEPEVFTPLFYGATHLELLLGPMPVAYLPWLLAALTLAGGAVASESSQSRQMGLACLLLIASGFAPTTPSTLLMWALASLLISRSIVGSTPDEAPTN